MAAAVHIACTLIASRIRIEGLKGPAIAAIVREVLAVYASELAAGCMITVKEQKTTCHLLRGSDD
jgi:hypothetical protein